MSERKRFLLRLDPALHAALERWAADELRSVNAQIEVLLREQTQRAGRLSADRPSDSRKADGHRGG
ncbi:MAG TPA: toxin-antitoxin system HicB family antitoxin [Solirubrobacteraceae bacterium]|nr:toxin-antitoxin system HicB family antitoxin [Solirubrobacteraceae bacterium]